MSLLTLLCTPADIQALKEYDLQTRREKIDPHIRSAQREDVAPLLGERLFNAVIARPQDFLELLEYGNYTVDEAGEDVEYINFGLKYLVALYSYARFAYMGSATPTPFGLVQKKNPNVSEEITREDKKTLFGEARKEAFTAWKSVEAYLIRTKHPLFNQGCQVEAEQNTGTMRFDIIGRRG